MQKMLVSPSPHISTKLSTRSLMRDVIIAMMPAVLIALVYYGWRFLMVLAVSVGSCVLLEWVITRFMLKRPSTVGDLSAVVTGILLAMNLPSLAPWWVVFIGALVAIGIAKMSFGGLGQNVFNPAIVARVFLLISFPTIMTTWGVQEISSAWSFSADAVTGPTYLSLIKEGADLSGVTTEGGSAGEASAIALIAGFVYLLVRRVIKPWITLSIWATVFLFALIMHLIDPSLYMAPGVSLMTGGLLLGSIFMATDYVTSPMTDKGGVIFGIGIGLLTVVIRYWGSYPEGVSFAILIMNAFVPLINKMCKSQKFGRA